MAKTISGHSTPKSARAMAIVAIPVAPTLHSWIRHCPHGSATGPYWGLPQTPVLLNKANSWLYIRPCLTKFKTPFYM